MSRDKFSEDERRGRSGGDAVDEVEAIRRDFAWGWAALGEAWGIAPSTAAVQGYFLLHGGPLTETELREALGLSHRAAFGALAECKRWGLIEAAEPVRTGRRGPAGRAWIGVGDHWEWFRRVAASRKEREADPILPLLDDCRGRADAAGDARLTAKIAGLSAFMQDFDRSIGAVVDADAASLARLVGVLARLNDSTVRRLLASLAAVPEDELIAGASRVAAMRPEVLRRLLRLATRPGVARLLDRIG